MLVRHYDWAGYDVLAITDHWVRTDEPSTPGLLVIPSAELNAIAPTRDDDAHVLALGLRGRPGHPRARVRAAAGGRLLGARERRRALSRPHLLERPARRAVGGRARACSGSRSGTPAASSRSAAATPSLHWDEALERGRRFYALATDDSHHPGFDSGFAWTWVRAPGEDAGGGARRAARRRVLRLDRAADRRGRGDRRRRHACAAARRRASRSTRAAGAARASTPAGSATRTTRQVLERTDDGLITAVRLERPFRQPYGRDRGRRRERQPGLDEPAVDRVASSRTARRAAVRPAGDRRRDHRRRDRRGRDRARARRRARRTRRLRGRDVERLVEAHPRRPALPADGRRAPRPRGAPGAPLSDERRRAASGRAAAVRLPALPRRPPPAVGGAHRGPPLLGARPREAERPREHEARAAPRAAAAHRGAALVGALRRRVDERRAADDRERPRRGRPRRGRPQLRRGHRCARGRRRRARRRADRARLCAHGRQRDRAVARPHPAARGSRAPRRRCA